MRSLAYRREADQDTHPGEEADDRQEGRSVPQNGPPVPPKPAPAAPKQPPPSKGKALESRKTKNGRQAKSMTPAPPRTVPNADLFHTLNYIYQRAHRMEAMAVLRGKPHLARWNAAAMRQFFALAKRAVIRVYVPCLTQGPLDQEKRMQKMYAPPD